jgi:hypothetical protein
MIFFPDLLKRTCTNRVHSGTMRNEKKTGVTVMRDLCFYPFNEEEDRRPRRGAPAADQ